MATATKNLKIFRYPYKKLESNEDLTSFAQPNSDNQNYPSSGTKDIRGTIILPIPENLPINGNTVSWGESKLGALQTTALGVGQNAIEGGFVKGIEALKTAATTGINALQTGRGQKMTQTFFAAKATEQLLGQDGDLFGTILGRTTGAVFNENVELLFRGITLRDPFSFVFNISPRFKEESQVVKEMIVFLKQEMSAKKGNTSGAAAGLFLTAPSVFRIQYMSGGNPHPYLNRFKICALNGISVNFTSSNTYTTYSDGTPVHMQLSLTFQELTPIYNEDYQNAVGTGY